MTQNPLSKADIANLHKAVVSLNSAQQVIDAAKRAGIDMTEHDERQTHFMGLANGILQAFGPMVLPAKGDQ